MVWFIEGPTITSTPQLTYGAPATFAITSTGEEVVAAGSSPRYMSISIPSDADPVYVSYGTAVDVSTKNYVYILPAGLQYYKIELPSQAVHMATASAGKTANIVIAVATEA